MRRVQIGIDDLSPRPTQSFELWDNVERLIEKGFKIDAFVTFAMIRDSNGPYSILNSPTFMKRLEAISCIPEVALNVHGYHHGWENSNNDEFFLGDKASLEERLSKIDNMIRVSGLDFKKVFRPPAFRICQNAIDLLIKYKYTHLSLVDGVTSGAYYRDLYSNLNFGSLKVHYSNCAPPTDNLVEGDLAITYHFSTWLANALSDKNTQELLDNVEDFEPYHIYEV